MDTVFLIIIGLCLIGLLGLYAKFGFSLSRVREYLAMDEGQEKLLKFVGYVCLIGLVLFVTVGAYEMFSDA